MPVPSSFATARKTDRLEAFHDAVFAIVITLPVVELRAPEVGPEGNLYVELMKLWPQYLAYLLSFIVIGIYWARSHFLGKILEKTDHTYNLLNLLFLGSLSVLPIPTRTFAEHVQGDRNSTTAALYYTIWLVMPAAFWTIKWFYVVNHGLVDPSITDAYRRRGKMVYLATTGALVLSAFLTLADWRVGTVLAGLVTLTYLLPPKSPEYKSHEEPTDELEEAEDRRRH